ncbi:MAG: hypothetical protein LC775_08960, partial [Acidobacteria bacterium]|nr:hypothetical protein [Acidobacteriota bacterium]
LLAYFGWIRIKAYYGYFGISPGLLNLSIPDYVLRSTDVTFGAVARLLAVGVVLIVLDQLIVACIRRWGAGGREYWIRIIIAAMGLVLLTIGLLAALGLLGHEVGLPSTLGAVVLMVGAFLVLRFGSVMPHRRVLPEQSLAKGLAIIIVTLVFAAFWVATLYAQDLGEQAAKAVDANPATLPLVTVFSKTFLDLPGSEVEVSQVVEGKYTNYRYSGLSLLTYANNRWFLISGKYSSGYRSSVVILQESEAIRIEVAVPQ